MKKFLCIAVVTTILFGCSIPSMALDNNLSNSIVYSEQDLKLLEEKEALIEEQYKFIVERNSLIPNPNAKVMPVTKTYTIPVTNYEQEKNNWCGAACIKQTLSFHKSNSGSSTALPSQSTIATKLGIYSSGGASSATMASLLNQYRGSYGYSSFVYATTDLTAQTDAYNWFYAMLRHAVINKTSAPIILIETGNLSGIARYYEASQYHCRHYNTIGGIRETTDAQNGATISLEIQTVDPHYDSRFTGKFWDIASGVYQCTLRADNNGSNKVIIF